MPTYATTSALRSIATEIAASRARIATGSRLVDPRRDAAAIGATRILERRRSDLAGSISDLSSGQAETTAALRATAEIRHRIEAIQTILSSASHSGSDLATLQRSIATELDAIAARASGRILSGTGGMVSWGDDGRGAAIDATATRLFAPDGTGVLQSPFDLSGLERDAPSTSGLSGTGSMSSGTTSSTPSTTGLSGFQVSTAGRDAISEQMGGIAGPVATAAGRTGQAPSTAWIESSTTTEGVAYGAARRAEAVVGTFSPSGARTGDTISMEVSVDGGTARTVSFSTRLVSDGTSLRSTLQDAVDRSFGTAVLTVAVDENGKTTFATVGTGAGRSVSVATPTTADGDDLATSSLGIQTQTTLSGAYRWSGNRNYVYDSLGVPDLTGIDRTDRLAIRVEVYQAASNRTISKEIVVSLADVGDAASLATSIGRSLQAESSLASAVYATEVGGEVALAIVSGFDSRDRIAATSIRTIQGDGQVGATMGLVAGSGSGRNETTAVAASVRTGTDFVPTEIEEGASMSFEIVSRGVRSTIRIDRGTVATALGASRSDGRILDATEMATVLRAALSVAGVRDVDATADGARIRLTSSGTPATGDALSIRNASSIRGEDTRGSATTGSAVTPTTLDDETRIAFAVAVDDGPSRDVSIERRDVDAALGSGANGRISNATDLAAVVSAAMTRRGIAGVSASAAGDRIELRSLSSGDGSSVSISGGTVERSSRAARTIIDQTMTGPTTIERDALLSFAVDTGATSPTTVSIDRALVEDALGAIAGRTVGTGRIEDATQLALVVDLALDRAGVAADADVVGGKVSLTARTPGAGTILVGAVTATASSPIRSSWTAGDDFSGPFVLDDRDSISFDVGATGHASVRVRVEQADVEAALSGTIGRRTGEVRDAGELALVVSRAARRAGAGYLDVEAAGDRLRFLGTVDGTGTVSVFGVVSSTGLTTSGGRLTDLDLTSPSFADLDPDRRAAVAAAIKQNLAAMAAATTRVDADVSFARETIRIQAELASVMDAVAAEGISRLVDVDLDEERARLAALEARETLLRRVASLMTPGRASSGAIASALGR